MAIDLGQPLRQRVRHEALNWGCGLGDHLDDSDESGIVECLFHEGPQNVRIAHDEGGDLWTVVVDRRTRRAACRHKGSGPRRAIITVSESSPRESGFLANVSRCSAQDFKDDVLACPLRQVNRLITIDARLVRASQPRMGP